MTAKRKPSYEQALALEKAQKVRSRSLRDQRAAREAATSKPEMTGFCSECGGWEGRHSNVCSQVTA